MGEARNVQAVRGWFAIQRSDVKKSVVDALLNDRPSTGLLFAGFEAGRHFQAEYPHLDPLNINVYDPMHEIPDAPKPPPTPVEAVGEVVLSPTLEENVEAENSQIKSKSVWIHRRTKDTCVVKKFEAGNVFVADSFGDIRKIPDYMFLQSFNLKGSE